MRCSKQKGNQQWQPTHPHPFPLQTLTPSPLPSGEGRLEIPFSPREKGMG